MTGVPSESVLVSGDVLWVDFSNTYDNVVQTSRLISDADFTTAVLFATEAEAQQAIAFFINGGWTNAVRDSSRTHRLHATEEGGVLCSGGKFGMCFSCVQIAQAFGEAYASSRLTSLRLVYPPGYVPAPVEFPPGSYPVTFTSYFTLNFNPSQTTLEEYLARFSAKYIETLAGDLGEMLCHAVNILFDRVHA